MDILTTDNQCLQEGLARNYHCLFFQCSLFPYILSCNFCTFRLRRTAVAVESFLCFVNIQFDFTQVYHCGALLCNLYVRYCTTQCLIIQIHGVDTPIQHGYYYLHS